MEVVSFVEWGSWRFEEYTNGSLRLIINGNS